MSQELVRSPVEIKICSFLKTLLAPTSRSSGTIASDDSARSLMASFEAFDRKPDVSIEESVVDPEIGEEMFGLDGFAESQEESVGLPGLDADNGSTPLFPDAEHFFPDEDVEEDWLSF